MGTFYEKVNSRKNINKHTHTNTIVTASTNQYQELLKIKKLNNRTVTTFSSENPAHTPTSLNLDDAPYFFNIQTLFNLLKKLPNKTSAGLDNIPSIVLKHLPEKIIKALTILFNNALNWFYYPKKWKCAKVLPISKKNKNIKEPTSYRPISLTSSISKLFEMQIDNAIAYTCKIKNIIPDAQFGFEKKLSTCHALNKFTSDIQNHLHDNEVVGACLVDIEKAFDSAWHEGLIYSLIEEEFPEHLIDLIYDMISDKKFVTWNGRKVSSREFCIEEGFQQGAVTSPRLFNILTRKVLKLSSFNKPNSKTYAIAYADDLVVYTADKDPDVVKQKLEKLVGAVNTHYINWNLRISFKKCETILFHKPLRFISPARRKKIKEFCIKIEQRDGSYQTIEHKKKVKYLGMELDYLCKINDHVSNQLNKATRAFKNYSRIFFNKFLEPRAKVIIYMLIIRPIITYAAPIWWNLSIANGKIT